MPARGREGRLSPADRRERIAMRIGIDLGGTKIEGIVLVEGGELRHRQRLSTPQGDYRGTLEAMARLVRRLEESCGETCTVGVGTPGSVSTVTGRLKNCNSTCLNGQPFVEDLSLLLERPVRIANDANCFALSEASDGAGAGASVVFGVILGTGVGGGIAVDGRILSGADGIAGEWGHNPLPWPRPEEWAGPDCYCCRTGCAETFLSGPGLARSHRELGGTDLAPEALVRAAEGGDPRASQALTLYEDRLARGLAGVVNLLDPEVIVLGGGLSKLTRLYESVHGRLARCVFSDTVRARIVPPAHGDSSGVRGAAWLWSEEESGG